MIFRQAHPKDIPGITALERLPEFRTFINTWSEDRHRQTLDDPDASYTIVESDAGEVLAFALLLGRNSEHKCIFLQRIVVGVPNQGIGKRLLETVIEKAFDEFGAHRLWLDVVETNDRARHIYRVFGFREDGVFREAELRDGVYHSLIIMSLLEAEYRAGEKKATTTPL